MSSTDPKELTKEEKDLVERVSQFFSTMDKLIRGMQLYEGTGPLVERLLGDTFNRLEKLVVEQEITAKITPVGAMFMEQPMSEKSSAPKYLFQLYCDGVREVSFIEGITEDEIIRFAHILNTDNKDSMSDMVTALWKEEFKGIRYYAVDSLGAQVDVEVDSSLVSKKNDQLTSVDAGEEMKLSSSDMRLLKAKNKLGWVRQCSAPTEATGAIASTVEQIRDRVQFSYDYRRFVAIALRVSESATALPMLQGTLETMIAQGRSEGVGVVFDALVDMALKEVEAANSLLVDMMQPDALLQLTDIFEAEPERFLSIFQKALSLSTFNPEVLVVLLKNLPLGDSRVKLQELLVSVDVDMTTFYLDSLKHEDTAVVVDAITALGKIGSDKALEALSNGLSNHLMEVRKAALLAMDGRYHAKAKTPLVKALKDPEKEIRMGALDILSTSQERLIGSALLGVMRTSDFYQRDTEEVEKFFSTLSQFPSPGTIEFLDLVLSEKNLTRSKAIIQRQVMAVNSLGNMDSPDAKPTLEKCLKRWFLPSQVKNTAKTAVQNK